MSQISSRASQRSLYVLLPVLLTGTVLLTARPTLALRQDNASDSKQDAKPDEKKNDTTYTIVRTYKAMDVDHYKMDLHATVKSPQTGDNTEAVLAFRIKETTKNVKGDGSAILIEDFEEANAKAGDQEQDVTAFMPTITRTADKMGRTLDTKLEGGNPLFTQGGGAGVFSVFGLIGAFYPPKPVKVNDTWQINATGADKNAPKTTGVGTVVGTDMINGVQTLKIKITTDSALNIEDPQTPGQKVDIKTHVDGIGNLDIATGKLVKLTATSKSDSGPFKKGEISYALVTGDAKEKKDAKPDDKKDGSAKSQQ